MPSTKKVVKQKEEVVPEKKEEPKKKEQPTGASQTRAHSITLTKINDAVVKPIKTSKDKDTRLPKAWKLFTEPYPNIAIIAKKKSGKTNAVVNIVKAAADKDTHVFVIASTAHKDPLFLALKKWCKKHNIPYQAMTEIKSIDENKNKSDFFESFMKQMGAEGESEEDETESEDEEAKHPKFSNYGHVAEESCSDTDYSSSEDEDNYKLNYGKKFDRCDPKFIKNKSSMQVKKPFLTPECIIITDDLSNELKTPSLRSFFKRNRHYRCMNIVSSQYLLDLLPESLKQVDYLLLFKGQTREKLEKIISDGDLSIPIDKFEAIYRSATSVPYGFLYVDTRNEQYRRCFSERYNVPVTDTEWH